MPISTRPEARAASLRRLHGLVQPVDLDLDRTLAAVCRGVVEGLGFRVAVVNLTLADGDLEVVACAGDADAQAALFGQRGRRVDWDQWMDRCTAVGDLLVDYPLVDTDDDVPTWISDEPVLDVEGAWDRQDALLAPLRTPRSGLLGVLSVDLPVDGLRPGPDQLELLEMYAAQASIAVENAQLHSSLKARDRDRDRMLGRLSAVVDSAPVGIVELDLAGRVQLWNAAAERIFGWTAQEVTGGRHPVASEESVTAQLRELRDGAPVRRLEVSRTRRDGTTVDVEMTSCALRDSSGQVYGYLGVYVDVTERLLLEQELRTAAFTDPLTGLANRARFTATLAASGGGASVVLLDLDGFKTVNDTLGHPAGDRVLVEVARRLRVVCRDDDLVARLGGDEFVVLLARPHRAPGAEASAEALSRRLVEVLAEPFEVGGHVVALGASVGLAHAEELAGGEAAGDALLRDADVAMYAAKAAGKGRARVFEPELREGVVERADLAQDLRLALARDELFLRWHPITEVRSGRVVGLEALVRWQHPQRGELLPGAFLPLAEEIGLMVPIGERVLAQACSALRGWQQLPGHERLSGSVNISATQLHAPGLVDGVRTMLLRTGIAPATLVLEVPEAVLLRDGEPAVAVLQRLHELGVRLAVDDFGAGYASLSYPGRLPVDVVKLDRPLIAHADTDADAPAMLGVVVAWARRLGLPVLVKGVETAGQWAALRRLGCRLAQGFLIAEPLRTGQVPALLAVGYPASAVPRTPAG